MGIGDQQHGFRMDAANRFGTAYQETRRDRLKRKQRRQLALHTLQTATDNLPCHREVKVI